MKRIFLPKLFLVILLVVTCLIITSNMEAAAGFNIAFEGIGRYRLQTAGSGNLDIQESDPIYNYNGSNSLILSLGVTSETVSKYRNLDYSLTDEGRLLGLSQFQYKSRKYIKEETGISAVDHNNDITNISKSYLDIGEESEVKKAVLQYAYSMPVSKKPNQNRIVVVTPRGNVHYLAAEAEDEEFSNTVLGFQGISEAEKKASVVIGRGTIDVTKLVEQDGSGWYYVGFLDLSIEGAIHGTSAVGAWSIVAVEENMNYPVRYTKLLAGSQIATYTNHVKIAMDVAYTIPENGEAQIVGVFSDGDAKNEEDVVTISAGGITKDLIRQDTIYTNAGGRTFIPAAPEKDFLNGTMETVKGSKSDFVNQNEYCLFNMNLDNEYVKEGKGFNFTNYPARTGTSVIGQALGISVDVEIPEISLKKSVTNITDPKRGTNKVIKGDILEYSLEINNNAEKADAYAILLEDILPSGIEYVKESANLNGNQLTDTDSDGDRYSQLNNRIQFEAGHLGAGKIHSITFRVEVTTDITALNITNTAAVNYDMVDLDDPNTPSGLIYSVDNEVKAEAFFYIAGSPVLETKKKVVIGEGDALDLMKLVEKAEDPEDGDLTSQVVIIDDGAFDSAIPGEYKIIYEVEDEDGNTATSESLVAVDAKPVIKTRDLVIQRKLELDLMSLLENMTDREDGDLLGQVQLIEDGGFCKDITGEYTLTYQVNDSFGHTITANSKVTVEDLYPELDTEIQVQYKQGSAITADKFLETVLKSIYDREGDVQISTNFEETVNLNAIGDYIVTVVVTDDYGQSTFKDVMVSIKDRSPQITILKRGNNTTIYNVSVSDVFYYVGEYPPLKQLIKDMGISAKDSYGTTINQVSIDTSKVDWNTPGVYEVTVCAVDKEGDITSLKARITILSINTAIVGKADARQPNYAPDTGDGTLISIWLSFIMISALNVVRIYKYKRK